MTIVYREPYWVGTCTASTVSIDDFFNNAVSGYTTCGNNIEGIYYGGTTCGTNDYLQSYNPLGNADAFIRSLPSPEEQRREEERTIALREENVKRLKIRNQAEKVARQLLLSSLDIVNRWRIGKGERYIEIPSQILPNMFYQIDTKDIERIKVYQDNKIVSELCLIGRNALEYPISDIVLTKWLNLMWNEKNTIKLAYHFNQTMDLKRMIRNNT